MNVGGLRAQNHNSSRSNRTSGIVGPPDDLNPDEEDGKTFDLFSTIDVQFDLSFSTSDPGGFAPELGDAPRATSLESALLELETGATFQFDKDSPDFGMLRAAGPPKQTHRGHVTVLKIAFGGGGGGGDIELAPDGIELALEPGSSELSILPNGDVSHRVDFTLDLSGSYFPAGRLTGIPFSLAGLSGSLLEQGRIANTIVPEPSGVALLGLGGLVLLRQRVRGR